ncbi:putative membrane protein [Emiliania huxleyi virus 164]|nr:putative membrane protein [Emiliania huxleyi virus 164]
MVNYDAAAYEKTHETDDATRMKNIKEAMGVDDTVHTPTEVKKRSDARNAQLQWKQLSKNNDIYDNKGYDKKTGKLTWIFDGGNGPRYANNDDIVQQELSDIFIQELSDFINS